MSDFLSKFSEENLENKKNELKMEKTTSKIFSMKEKKYIILSVFFVFILVVYAYFQLSKIVLPNFIGKEISEAKIWAVDHGVKLNITTKYSTDESTSIIIEQRKKKNYIRKGDVLHLIVSEGPNPNETLSLPDFEKMTQLNAQKWISENKAENISIISEYHSTVPKGSFIKLVLNNEETTTGNYKRKDKATVYYSKGKEVYEKNIEVPSFENKTKQEVEEWALKNKVKVDFLEQDHKKVDKGLIITQSIIPRTKIAKDETIAVTVSLGNPILVPDFSQFTSEEAATVNSDLRAVVRFLFSESVPYGELISQSLEPEAKLYDGDDKRIIVTYSSGKPYIKSYFDKLEGDIPSIIKELNDKGAAITYAVNYIDSNQERGKIVESSHYNQYIDFNTHIIFSISNGKFYHNKNDEPIKE